MIRWVWPCLALGALGSAEPVVPPPEPATTTIQVQPAAVPRPALKYHLIPERYGLQPGNAALSYERALLLYSQQTDGGASLGPGRPTPSPDEQAHRWINQPPSDLPRDEVRRFLDRYTSVFREIEFGARREQCNWGLDHRDQGVDLLLPEIQNTRILARLIALQARLAIAEGRWDQAWASIQTGFVLARHVGDGPSLIQGLVGVATAQQMCRCLELLIGSPGAPSFCWALADRPRPLVDLRAAYEVERHIIEKEFPALLELDQGVWSVDQSRRLVAQLQAKIFNLVDAIPGSNAALPRDLSPTARQLTIAALCAQVEPEARRALIAEGRPAAEVAAMPVVQAAMLFIFRELQERRDASFKWANVRYASSTGRLEPPALTVEAKRANPLLAIFTVYEGGMESVRLAAVRLDRQLDALQVVEAIRLDATRHNGQLPATLAAIADLPIPLDPGTGRPFEYRVTGTSATLAAPSFAAVGFNEFFALQIHLIPAQP